MVALLCAAAASCGKSESKSDPAGGSGSASGSSAAASAAPAAAPASPSGDLGGCKIDISGDVTLSASPVRASPGDTKTNFGTDYWLTDSELETALGVMVSLDSKADKKAKVAEAMKQDPRFFLYMMTCGDDQFSVSFTPGNGSKYADVPRGPKKYPLVKDPKAGEFGIMFQLKNDIFGVAEPGTFEVTRFDSSHVTGTFAFRAEQRFATGTAKKVQVAGSFDLICYGSQSCGK